MVVYLFLHNIFLTFYKIDISYLLLLLFYIEDLLGQFNNLLIIRIFFQKQNIILINYFYNIYIYFSIF